MEAAKKTHERYKSIIEEKLRSKDICKRLEYTGSSYEGVKVRKSPSDMDLEFDIQVILVGGDRLEAVEICPGFARLVHRNYVRLEALTDYPSLIRDGNQLPEETASKFHSAMQLIINENEEMRRRINLRKHGPAVQMDVYKDDVKREKFFSVDMVPTFELGNRRYVSKPLKEGSHSDVAWRQSFSVEEKNKLMSIDADNGCRKQVLRVLKVLRNRSAELRSLESCHFKRALFQMVDEMSSKYNWMFDRLGVRTIDILRKMESQLSTGCLPHYFLPQVNQISSWNSATIQNVRDRLHRLVTNEREFMALIS